MHGKVRRGLGLIDLLKSGRAIVQLRKTFSSNLQHSNYYPLWVNKKFAKVSEFKKSAITLQRLGEIIHGFENRSVNVS